MMHLVSTLIWYVGVPVLFIAGLIVFVVRHGFKIKQLATDGVETTGIVSAKLMFRPGGHPSRTYRILYTYRDEAGRTHKGKSGASKAVYDAVDEGGPIAVVYSRSKPHVSGLQYQVEQVRRVT